MPRLIASAAHVVFGAALLLTAARGVSAEPAHEKLSYAAADPDLKVVRIDSDPRESFLAIEATTSGRLFVGGREALFVYEPDDQSQTGYGSRRELYRFPNDTWIYNIAVRGPDVYVLTVSALYVLPGAALRSAVSPGADFTRAKPKPKRLVFGVPMGHVHQCFHGLAIGPEGDLYFAMGDPLWYYGDFERPDHWGHWTFFSQPDGAKTPYHGVGGVFRCRPDGSGFQIVSRGLRNPCGLAFDRDWNLFSNDNDHEGLPSGYVPGRLLHVTPHSYFSWPRGWMVSKTPDRADLLETMFDGMGRAVPVGMAYYDDPFLPAAYRNNLFVARWGIRAVTRYPLEPRGASFQVKEEKLLEARDIARPVDVAVGRGGRVFTSIAYMAHNEGSPVYQSDPVMITRRDDSPPFAFDAYDHLAAKPARLWSELANAAWGRRYRAHVEILRRGGELFDSAVRRLAQSDASRPEYVHLIWLAAVSDHGDALAALLDAAKRQPPRGRIQALRALTERVRQRRVGDRQGALRRLFIAQLAAPEAQAHHAALLGLFELPGPPPPEVAKGPARERDTYLRQTATLLLAEKADFADLAALCQTKDAAGRLAGVLASGFRLTVPAATEPAPKELKLQPGRGPVIQFAREKVDLRTLGPLGNYTIAEKWRDTPRTPEQEKLFALLKQSLGDKSEAVRLQTAHFLSLLNDPRSEPGVAAVRKASDERRLQTAKLTGVTRAWVVGPFDDGDEGFRRAHPPQQAAIDLGAAYKSGGQTLHWKQAATPRLFDFRKTYGPCDRQSFYAYFHLDSASRQRVNLLLGSDDGVQAWLNGREIWTNDVSRGALPFQDVVSAVLEPGSNDVVVRVRNIDGACGLYLHYRALGEVVARLPEKLALDTLAERLKAATGPVKYGPEFLDADWLKASEQGDPQQGRKLFEALACAKCHAVSPNAQSGGGPSLADAARRFTVAHLVQSILLPNKQISPVFKATTLVTKDGLSVTGLVVGETADKLDLLLPDAKKRTVMKADIEARQLRDLSPMPEGVIKKPQELRDILAFLIRGAK